VPPSVARAGPLLPKLPARARPACPPPGGAGGDCICPRITDPPEGESPSADGLPYGLPCLLLTPAAGGNRRVSAPARLGRVHLRLDALPLPCRFPPTLRLLASSPREGRPSPAPSAPWPLAPLLSPSDHPLASARPVRPLAERGAGARRSATRDNYQGRRPAPAPRELPPRETPRTRRRPR
jgi:hypothetical protein